MPVWSFYAALAALACFLAWRSFEVRPVGIALVLSLAASNAAQWLPVMERPAAYTVCEVMVLSMAFLANVCGAGRAMVAVVTVCIVSIGSNLYMTWLGASSHDVVLRWELVTNLCFGAECLLVIADRLYARTHHRSAYGGTGDPLHGGAAARSEATR